MIPLHMISVLCHYECLSDVYHESSRAQSVTLDDLQALAQMWPAGMGLEHQVTTGWLWICDKLQRSLDLSCVR